MVIVGSGYHIELKSNHIVTIGNSYSNLNAKNLLKKYAEK